MMTLGELVKSVKYAINEECVSNSLRTDGYAENEWRVILHAARHAVSWIAKSAPVELLDGGDTSDASKFLVNGSSLTVTNGVVTLPSDCARIARVRLSGWHKAVSTPINEDSQEYLELMDDVACATNDRPVAAIINSSPKKLELYPKEGTLDLTYVSEPTTLKTALASELTVASLATELKIPPKAETLFVYYTAYLVLRAYRDDDAAKMLEVIKNYLS